jgi:hypothetical protein
MYGDNDDDVRNGDGLRHAAELIGYLQARGATVTEIAAVATVMLASAIEACGLTVPEGQAITSRTIARSPTVGPAYGLVERLEAPAECKPAAGEFAESLYDAWAEYGRRHADRLREVQGALCDLYPNGASNFDLLSIMGWAIVFLHRGGMSPALVFQVLDVQMRVWLANKDAWARAVDAADSGDANGGEVLS